MLLYSRLKNGGQRPMPEQIERLIEEAAAALKAAGAREVYVFGSAAKGELRENSDVDMAVSGLPPEAFFRAMAKASRALRRPLDLVDWTRTTLSHATSNRKANCGVWDRLRKEQSGQCQVAS